VKITGNSEEEDVVLQGCFVLLFNIGRGFKVFYNRRYFLNFRRYLKN
jgi:hypothetical protein